MADGTAAAAVADDDGSTTESEVYEFEEDENGDFGHPAASDGPVEPNEKLQRKPVGGVDFPSLEESKGAPSSNTATVSDSESSADEKLRRGQNGKRSESSRDGKMSGGERRREEKIAPESQWPSAQPSSGDRRVSSSNSSTNARLSRQHQSRGGRDSAGRDHNGERRNCNDTFELYDRYDDKKYEKRDYSRSRVGDNYKRHGDSDAREDNHVHRSDRSRSPNFDRHERDSGSSRRHEHRDTQRHNDTERSDYRDEDRYRSSSRPRTSRSHDFEHHSRDYESPRESLDTDRRYEMRTESSRDHRYDYDGYSDHSDRYNRPRSSESRTEYTYERETNRIQPGRRDREPDYDTQPEFHSNAPRSPFASYNRNGFDELPQGKYYYGDQRPSERDYYDTKLQNDTAPPQPALTVYDTQNPNTRFIHQGVASTRSAWRDPTRDPRLARKSQPATVCQHDPPRPAKSHARSHSYINSTSEVILFSQPVRASMSESLSACDSRNSKSISREQRFSEPPTRESLTQPDSLYHDYSRASSAAQSPSRKRHRSPSPARSDLKIGGVDKKYIEQVRFFKTRSRFIEQELEKAKDENTRDYLVHRQEALRGVKKKLLKAHPEKFADVFNAIQVTFEDITQHSRDMSLPNCTNHRRNNQELDRAHSQESGHFSSQSIDSSRQRDRSDLNSALKAQRPSPKHRRTSSQVQTDLVMDGVSKGYIDRVRLYKVTSCYVEEELETEMRANVRKYLLGRQETLQAIKKRLMRERPDKFDKVFEAVRITSEDIEQYRYEKMFSNRVFRYRCNQEDLDKRRAAIERGEEQPSSDIEWKQRKLNDDRDELLRSNETLFYDVMSRPVPALFYRQNTNGKGL